MKTNKLSTVGFLFTLVVAAILFIAGCVTGPSRRYVALPGFQPSGFDEQVLCYTNGDVKTTINAPMQFVRGNKMKLVFFALPNGNTTAQTIGKLKKPGDPVQFDIQHIGAQTRFLRNMLSNTSIVVVYLEAREKTLPLTWPGWGRAHADHPEIIPPIFDSVRERFKDFQFDVTLSSHSGGGSVICRYLNTQTNIPKDIERIAFLDSDYAYDTQLHAEKLLRWLRGSEQHYLSVLAYNDAIAELDGKHFVSANGGTWGRTHAMLDDLKALNFTCQTNGSNLATCTALNRRVEFNLKENPEKKIYHTIQVEKNGFIQTMLSGTRHEGEGYEYFGLRAYTNWIAAE